MKIFAAGATGVVDTRPVALLLAAGIAHGRHRPDSPAHRRRRSGVVLRFGQFYGPAHTGN